MANTRDYYYESLPKEIQDEIEKDPTKANNVGTYTIEWYEVVAAGGANTGKNGEDGDWTGEENYKPTYTNGIYKSPISSVSDKKMTYHLDGLIVLHDTTHINVQFKVQDVGKDTFALVRDYGGAFTVQNEGDSIQLNTIARPDVKRDDQTEAVCPDTKITADGTVYTFKGWYTDENCTREADFVNGTISTDTTFYAKYVPASANLTISKTVTGKLGDTNKAFTFTITKADGTAANITDTNIEISEADRAKVEWKGNGQFTLKDGASIIFKNLPSGQYKVVEDNYSGEKYETSYVVDSGTPENRREASVTIGTDAKTIAFTNNCTLQPDLGVLLDTPYYPDPYDPDPVTPPTPSTPENPAPADARPTVTETTTPSAPEPTAPASVVADARPAEGPKLIQTGQLNWPIPVLTASGLVLVAVGAYLMERSKKREKNA